MAIIRTRQKEDPFFLHYTAYGGAAQKSPQSAISKESRDIFLRVLGGLPPTMEATSRGAIPHGRIFVMARLRSHWRLVLGALPIALEIWRWIRRALEWGEHTEFVAHHLDDLKEVWAVIIDPPWWANGPLIVGGLLLIWFDLKRSGRQHELIAATGQPVLLPQSLAKLRDGPPWPNVAQWFAPLKALDQFVDKALLNAAVQALNDARAAKEARDAEFKDKSPYEIIRIDATNEFSKKAQDTENAFMFARKRVFDELIRQMKEGILVGRALPFDDKKLEDRDWEIIKSSHGAFLDLKVPIKLMKLSVAAGVPTRAFRSGSPNDLQFSIPRWRFRKYRH
jgi:hypothetical protein